MICARALVIGIEKYRSSSGEDMVCRAKSPKAPAHALASMESPPDDCFLTACQIAETPRRENPVHAELVEAFLILIQRPARLIFPSPWQSRSGIFLAAPWIPWRLGRPAFPFHPWRIFRDLPKTCRCALRPPGCAL